MILTTARALFAGYLLSEDSENPPITTTDRDSLLNEAVLAYHARFGANFKYTGDTTSNLNVFNFGVAGDLQWIEPLTIERRTSTGIYLPLKSAGADGWGKIRFLHRTEAQTGFPLMYGLALVSRDIGTTTSVFSCAVYPSPAGNVTYRARYRPYAAELVNGTDVIPLDEAQADAAVRIAALNAGLVLGYSGAWASKLLAPLDDQERTLIEISKATSKYVAPGGRG